MTPQPTVLILGSGQAGFQAAVSLRDLNFGGRIILLGDEPCLPYYRPPLSKAFLFSGGGASEIALRPSTFYEKRNIELRHGTAVHIDRGRRVVTLGTGDQLAYDHLVLALGARNRVLRLPGADLPGVHQLRTQADAERLRSALDSASSVASVGAGFIGMEILSAAAKLGKQTAVIDPRDRPLARALSVHSSQHFARLHNDHGTRMYLRQQCVAFHGDTSVDYIELRDGTTVEADLVVIGVGVEPNSELAERAGLAVADGILVDQFLQTSDPAVFAIGDCARFPAGALGRMMVRLESVQNAVDQARSVAERIMGSTDPFGAVPWFWSEQFGTKLQIAGLSTGYDVAVPLGDPESSTFSILLFRNGRLICVESINRPVDHMSARRLLAGHACLSPEAAQQGGFDLKTFVQAAA
ncbi:NAD(P)/FAD-dependent oxidoreductase [Rhodococcus sp. NPDC127530]|uniref:NAD(P)/FAD-dependent oxidoreductase n=1 Tax=unclassified Rhodococcus (in: high G+C Gram-positive bacteria) TaxID=192944 RepID=UPI00362E7B75